MACRTSGLAVSRARRHIMTQDPPRPGPHLQVGKTRWQGQFNVFKALNLNSVTAVRSLRHGVIQQPASVLQGRILRVATQVRWSIDRAVRAVR